MSDAGRVLLVGDPAAPVRRALVDRGFEVRTEPTAPVDCVVRVDGGDVPDEAETAGGASPPVVTCPGPDGPLSTDGLADAVAAVVADGPPDDADRGASRSGDPRRLSALVEQSPLGVIEWSLDRTVRRWNAAATDIFGYSDAYALGREADFLIPEEDESAIERAWQDIVESPGGTEVVTRNRRADGELIDCKWHNERIVDDDGELTAVLSMVEEVTARKRRETQIETLHESTRELMQAETKEAIGEVAIDAARRVLGMPYSSLFLLDEETDHLRPVVNAEAAREEFGPAPTFEVGEGILGSAFENGDAEIHANAQTDDRALSDGSSGIRGYIALPLGDHGALSISSPVVGDFDERDLPAVEVLAANVEAALDRAEREQALQERERELAAQNERLDEFSSMVSHDLRNPLMVAQGFTESLRGEPDPDAVDEIEAALDRMESLIDDVLTLARQGALVGERRLVDLGTIAADAWETVATGDATLRRPADPVSVEADPDRLTQCLENLFANAVEHGGEGVTVTVERTPSGFAVADDGPGIPSAERDRIFDPGVSGGDGTGLGLAIVERIADAHGWTVSVADGSDGGARFVFDVQGR